jgi:hypothetical protein
MRETVETKIFLPYDLIFEPLHELFLPTRLLLTTCRFDFTLLYKTKTLIDRFSLQEPGDIHMATYLYLATAIGLFIATQTDGNWTIVRQALKEQPLTSVAVSKGVILAGTTEGIWRSTDNGQTWCNPVCTLDGRFLKNAENHPGWH